MENNNVTITYTINSLDKEKVIIDAIRNIKISENKIITVPYKTHIYKSTNVDKLKAEIPQPYLDAILSFWGVTDNNVTEEEN